MKMKFTDIPSYEEVEIVGKTVDATTGTIDRKKIGRCLITEATGFEGKHQVVGGDGTAIQSVTKFGEDQPVTNVELWVEFVGGIKSLASYKFFDGWFAKNRENEDVNDLFTTNGEQIEKICACAMRMASAHPECDGQWKLVDANGTRWFLRLVNKSLTANGRCE